MDEASQGQSTLSMVLDEFPGLKQSRVPSDYAQKLKENYIPDAAEAAEVKAFATQINQQAAQISKEMALLKARILSLKSKQTRIVKEQAPYQAIASASRRLPTPVLQRIFVECLSNARNAVMHTAEAPLLLGRVCSRWRIVAYSTPELWARLHIVPPYTHRDSRNSEERFVRKREEVQTWLSRSGDCPLHLSFVWFGLATEEAIRLNGMLLESLVPLSKRWREIDVQAPMILLAPFCNLSSEDVPILRIISLMGSRGSDLLLDGESSAPGISDIVTLVGRASRLHELSLAFNISDTLPSGYIPWHQLEVLYLESNARFFFADFDEMAKALVQCKNLRSLSLKYPINQTEVLPPFKHPDTPVLLPNLEVLCVDGDQHLRTAFDMAATFSSFVTPKLQELAILGRPPRDLGTGAAIPESPTIDDSCTAQDLLTGIRDLLRASSCPLQRLKLESVALKSDVFFECLEMCPETEELIVYSYFLRGLDMDGTVDGDRLLNNDLLRLMTPSGLASRKSERPNDEDAGELSLSASHSTSHSKSKSVLCPCLKIFDYTLSDVDEDVFRHFVESRSINREPGIAKLESVKTSLTGRETKEVKQWVSDIRKEGIELALLYHSPFIEDVNPSPWSGISGL